MNFIMSVGGQGTSQSKICGSEFHFWYLIIYFVESISLMCYVLSLVSLLCYYVVESIICDDTSLLCFVFGRVCVCC